MKPTDVLNIDNLERAAEDVSAALYPYDRSTDPPTRTVLVPMDHDRSQFREEKHWVTEDFDLALTDSRFDYWHKGGEIVGKSGKFYGTHPADWFIKSHKWEKGRPVNEGSR